MASRHARDRPQERLPPSAQLQITDVNGWRVTAFATKTPLADPAANCPTSNCGTDAAPAPKAESVA
jgi:hypothetical protein